MAGDTDGTTGLRLPWPEVLASGVLGREQMSSVTRQPWAPLVSPDVAHAGAYRTKPLPSRVFANLYLIIGGIGNQSEGKAERGIFPGLGGSWHSGFPCLQWNQFRICTNLKFELPTLRAVEKRVT